MKKSIRLIKSTRILVFVCIALCCTALLGLVACGGSSASSSAASSNGSESASVAAASTESNAAEFTDSLGRTVESPGSIERVAVSGAISQQVMFTFAPDLLVGLCDEMNDAEKNFDSLKQEIDLWAKVVESAPVLKYDSSSDISAQIANTVQEYQTELQKRNENLPDDFPLKAFVARPDGT